MTKEELIDKVIQLNIEGEKDKNKYQEVIVMLPNEVLEKEKSDILYAEKSLAYYRLKKYEESNNEAEKALVINPDNAKANHYSGNFYCEEKKEYKKAEEFYLKAIKKDPGYAYPYNGLGNVYYFQKKYKKAEEFYLQAIEKDPFNSYPYNGLGNIYYSEKDLIKAEEYYKKAIELDSDSAHSYRGLGNIFYGQKEYAKGEEYYLKAIEKDPELASSYNNLGNIYKDQKHYLKAEMYYKKVLEIDPDLPYPYYGIGNIYKDQQNYTLAEEYYKKAIEIDPSYTFPYNSLGNIYKDQQNYTKAEEYYSKAIELDPDFTHAYNGLGNVYSVQKDYTKGEEFYKKAIEKGPEMASAYNGLGNIYKDLKDYLKAEKFYQKAIEINPEIAHPYYNLGLLYYFDFEPKKLQKAKENFEIKIELTKENPDKSLERAKTYITEIDKILNSTELSDIIFSKDKIKNFLEFKNGEISHFTSLSIVNILIKESSPFRLSEATFLNDSSEGKTLFDFLDYNEETNVKAGHEYTFAKKPFIGSFVHDSKHNDLALWRLYGKEGSEEGKGCSITLDSSHFLQLVKDQASEATKQNFDNEFQFYKVAYWDNKDGFLVDNKPNSLLKKAMQELKKNIDVFKNKSNRAPEENLNVQEALNEIAYLFKNKEYQYENEIRLVIKDPFGYEKHLAFEPDSLTTKVYIELCPIQKCISSISIGPKTPNKDDWAAYFYYYFDQLPATEKMDKIKIMVSTLPYK